jgi:hypothetical protein
MDSDIGRAWGKIGQQGPNQWRQPLTFSNVMDTENIPAVPVHDVEKSDDRY